MVWFGPGADNKPDNFGVIRFTVPSGGGGTYEVATAVRSRLDNGLSQDADFHVVRNDVEIFSSNLPPQSTSGYTNVLSLTPGETIDFMVGRGADGTEYGGGLKIAVKIDRRLDAPATIALQPQSQIIQEPGSGLFTAGASGSPQPTYQWFRDGSEIAGATNASYFLPIVRMTDNGALFKVVAANVVSNLACTATSSVASLTVIADTNPPTVVSVRSAGLGTIQVTVSERVALESATSLSHYALVGPSGPISIRSVSLDAAQTSILLSVDPMTPDSICLLTINGITDLASSANALTDVSVGFVARPLSVLITELVAENAAGLMDQDGDHSDWIELQNQTAFPVDLAGWRLADKQGDPVGWTFPTVLLQPAQFIVVFASGKDRRVAGAELHTNFKLNGDGEYLALVRPDGSLAQEFTFPKQRQDVAYGFANGTPAFFSTPTPGATNGIGVLGFVADTKVTPSRGFFSNAFALTISSATATAEIWYTLNGNVPAPGAPGALRYTNSLILSNTTTLRTAAFLANYVPTGVDTHTFIFAASAAKQPANPPGFPATWAGSPADYAMDQAILAGAPPGYNITNSLLSLPAISLVAPFDDLFDQSRGIYCNSVEVGPEWEREASIELIFPDGAQGFQHEAGLRMHGYSSRYHYFTSKHSFHLNFRARYGPSRLRFPLFPDTSVTNFDQIVLRGCSTDSYPAKDIHVSRWDSRRATYIRDQWMRDAMRDLGHPSSHGRYVHLWLNGLYWGLYNVAELLGNGWAADYFGGDEEDYDVIKDFFVIDDGDAAAWNQLETLVAPGVTTEAVYQRIQGNNADGTRNTNYPVYIDLPAYVDYILLHINAAADDWPDNNWWSCRRRGPDSEGFQFAPWDQEISNYSLTSIYTDYGQRFEEVNSPDRAGYFYDRLRQYGNFRQLFMDRVWFAVTGNGPLAPGPSAARWLARQGEIDRAIIAETARWGDSGHVPASTRANWLNEMQWVANFWASNQVRAIQRFRNVNLWPLLGPPAFSQPGGYFASNATLTITHTNPAGTIWFTLDGKDPRGANASPSATAQPYAGQINLTASTQVRARVTDGTNWSPPISANFLPVGVLTNLVLTEVYYNPPGEPGTDGDAFEFVELQNRGSFALDVSGVHFTSGIGFAFTNGSVISTGAFVVLGREAAGFAARFPGVSLFGLYGSKLDNGGETISLADALGGTLFSLTYDDTAPWPLSADGFGDSLQRVRFRGDANDAAQWVASPPTPGTASLLLDRDGDGLPDTWEVAQGLDPDDANGDNGANGDPDQDTRTNLQEYLSGSEATNFLSVLRIESVAATPGATFAFRASSNKTYTVQYTSGLGRVAWSNLLHYPARLTNRLEIVVDAPGSGTRFYRVVTPRQP